MAISLATVLTVLSTLATPENRAKAISFLKDHWKTIGAIVIIGYLAFNYWHMGNEIERLQNAAYSNEIVIAQYEDNEELLVEKITKQNSYINELEAYANKQKEEIDKGRIAATMVANEYEQRIRDILNRPPTIITCQDNMQWMIDEAENLEWTF